MTFALGAHQNRDCDCDECGLDTGSMVPVSIANAIREHKRLKLMNVPVRRTQERVLLTRENGISVWELIMPLDAEPLIEFGYSHRIIFVKTLKKASVIKTIGKGIVGSSDEEQNRQRVSWSEGKCYLIPTNGGKALGWIHGQDPAFEEKVDGHAILYYIKITLDALEDQNEKEEENATSEWVKKIRDIFRKVLPIEENAKGSNVKKNEQDFAISPLKDIDASEIQKTVFSLTAKP